MTTRGRPHLSAAEFIGHLVEIAATQPQGIHHRQHPLLDLGCVALQPVDADGFRDDLPDVHARVQRGIRAGWNSSAPAGRARGVACCVDCGTVVASVAEVSVEGGQFRVHKVTAAVDPGLIVNPNGVAAQVEGNVIMGLSSALLEEVVVTDGVLNPANFGAYRILSLSAAPAIEVVLPQGDDQPHGIGEPPLGPIAPAAANAVFALTGKRLRRLPLRLEATA
jgi:CO/xanthine dehydrogenase Mo-binding subunit